MINADLILRNLRDRVRIALISAQDQQTGAYPTAFQLAGGKFAVIQVYNGVTQAWEEVDYVFDPACDNYYGDGDE